MDEPSVKALIRTMLLDGSMGTPHQLLTQFTMKDIKEVRIGRRQLGLG